MPTNLNKEDFEDYEDEEASTIHAILVVLLNDDKIYNILRVTELDTTLVIVNTGNYTYNAYEKALTNAEADEIIAELKRLGGGIDDRSNRKKAKALLRQYFKPKSKLCGNVDEVRLDDAIPDEFYDAWKKFEGVIVNGWDDDEIWEEGIKAGID